MKVKMLVMDVDGTLTDGRIYVGSNGEMMKAFDVKDGYAIVHLRENGIEPVIITGRSSEIVQKRAEELGITALYQGVNNKLEQLKIVSKKYNCTFDDIAYIGDDLNDLECVNYCGVTGCPNDAVDLVRRKANYICQNKGGRGAVREFIDWIINEQQLFVSRCSNNYGPYHFPEKLIPLMIINALNDKPLPVYGKGQNVRDWLYVEDHCRAIDLIIHNGRSGEVYNVGGHNEMKNIDIVKIICRELGKPESLITFVPDRKGHDLRYAIDPTKVRNELGWEPETAFADGIKKTIHWYLEHREWWEQIVS